LDGVPGSRMIFRNAGAWKLSDQTSLIAGNIDWKGRYVNGRPTRVLSWWGPASRYFPYFDSGNPFTGVFRQEIYQNGELFAVTPHRVLGAALLKSSDGQEWLIAVCYDGANDIAYRRPAIKSDSSSLFDPIVAPDGWLEIGRLSDASLLLADRPWFFNSSGTAAQTLRTAQKTSEESNIFGTKLDRLKATVTRDNVSFERSGNLGPVVGTRTFVPRKSITIETAGDFRVTTYSGGRTFGFSEVGEYIVAVDFRKDEPVECRIVVNNTVSKNVDAIRSAVDCIRNCGGTSNSFDETFKQTDQTVTSEKLQCGAEEVTLVGDKQTIVANARRTSAGSGDYEGTREVVETDFNGSVLAADSRHSMLASVTNDTEGGVSDVFLVPNRFQSSGRPCSSLLETNQHGSALVRRRLDEILLIGRKIVASDRSDTIAGERQSVEAVLVYQAAQLADPQTDCFLQEHSGATETRRFPELFASPISGAWQIDGAEHLLVSQEIPGGAFNYLSDGSLSQIIPPGASGSRYYPAFVIK